MRNKDLINYLYENFINSENDWKELRKRMIFARAHLCSSSLISWLRRKNLDQEKYKEIRKFLTGHPDSIDNYIVKTIGSIYDIEARLKLTDHDYGELLIRSQKIEKFIKEDLEKGTEWEGEFNKRFPILIEHEESNWGHYEIMKKIKSGEIKL
ncbi:MAG: hypothetical protein I3273_07690 [Candidatus Moeniiplasma glomeromycotorum]|nr:hypothetical protein [Candidatus Moeniiplasma glomeromycotorum]MCE8169962.1 hypothetical protein [Candidatus Moeniiplasma glomeromycotorum]